MTYYEFQKEISDKEYAKRLTSCLILFSDILPIYEKKHQAAFRGIFGQDMSEIIPKFLYDLSIQCSKSRDETTPYLLFLKESLDHILGLSDKLPDVNAPAEEIEKMVNKRIAGLNLSDKEYPKTEEEKND